MNKKADLSLFCADHPLILGGINYMESNTNFDGGNTGGFYINHGKYFPRRKGIE